jgi:serine/threonine protein phosphatase 1
MFLSFFQRRAHPQQRTYQVPAGQRIYAIGDIHGRADLLKNLQEQIVQDANQSPHFENWVVYLGDYVDRGPSVQETVDLVLNGFGDGFKVTWLRGNHEQLLLDFLEVPQTLPAWLDLGGLWTLRSYGVQCSHDALLGPQGAGNIRKALIAALPVAHLSFLSNLPVYKQFGDYLFVHAGVRPGVPLERQASADLLWIRNEFLESHHQLECMVVHGHTVINHPEFHFGRVGIDTGAYATGILTCAVFEEKWIRFLDTGPAK